MTHERHVLDCTVITTTHPEYHPLLMRAVQSVTAQAPTSAKWHIIANDVQRTGDPVWQMNRLLRSVDTEWVAFCAGDDQWATCHLDELRVLAEENPLSQVCYTAGLVMGGKVPSMNQPVTEENADELKDYNWIPATAMIRTKMLQMLGGWSSHPKGGMEDWLLWQQILRRYGPTAFAYSPTPTWIYHFHGQNKSIKRAQAEMEEQRGRQPVD